VNDAVGSLILTKVLIAHRAETIRMAGRVIELKNSFWEARGVGKMSVAHMKNV
jgi:hypothetical protein